MTVTSQFNADKTASSALLFTVVSLLAASFSPAVAAPAINTTDATSIESSAQGFPASTNSATKIKEREATASLPSARESVPSPTSALSSVQTNTLEHKSINDEDKVKSEENHSAFSFSNPIQSKKIAIRENPRSAAYILNTVKQVKPPAKQSSVASVNSPSQSPLPLTDRDTPTSTEIEAKVKDLTIPISPENKAVSMKTDASQDESTKAESAPDSADNAVETTDDSMSQVTNVSQLRDVRPGDWAYEALRELVERYGCIAGYPDSTYRGNRAMSRYEFAAGVRACLNQIEKLIAASTSDFTNKQDLEALRRLTQEFQAEIATLGTRVDKLDGRVGVLENHQFSTTTRLFGQAVVGVQGRTKNNVTLAGFRFPDNDTNVSLINNVQLSLLTQFSPRSILLTGLAAGNGFSGGLTNDVRLGYEANTPNNALVISDLSYRQLIGNNLAVIVGPAGVNPVNVFRGINRVEGAGQGPLSLLAQRNPIINIGSGQGGVGIDYQINPRVSLQAVYSASLPGNSTFGGAFGGTDNKTTVGAQLTVAPTDTINVSFDYLNAYANNGFLGTSVGDDQLALSNRTDGRVALKTNAFGGTVEWRITPGVILGGWGGYTTSKVPGESGTVETVNWMAFLNFPDLLGQGNLAGIYVGQPPKITGSSLSLAGGRNVPRFISRGTNEQGGDPSSTLHVEGFYRFRVTDNISITPGAIAIFNPRQNSANDTIVIGAIRTTFSF